MFYDCAMVVGLASALRRLAFHAGAKEPHFDVLATFYDCAMVVGLASAEEPSYLILLKLLLSIKGGIILAYAGVV